MATHTNLDLRRHDLRTTVLENPYWITSGPIVKEADDLAAILFSFPLSVYRNGLVIIQAIYVEIVTVFAGGTITLDIGSATLATDDVTTDGVSTDVDVDEYVDNTEITHGTIGKYFPATGDWITAALLQTWLEPAIIVPLDAAVPCVCAYLVSDAAITAGEARVKMLVSVPPSQ